AGFPAPIPDSDDTVAFSQASANTSVDLNGSRTVKSLTFGGNTGYTLTSDESIHSLTLVDGDVTATGTATHEFNIDVTLDSSGTWSIGNPLVKVNRLLTTGNLLTKTGTGTLSFTDGDEIEKSSIANLHVNGGTVLIDGGTVNVGALTKLQTSTSKITVKGGTLETGQLSNDSGVTATVSISDPASEAALIVGGTDSSTFDGLIKNATGGSGSLKKVGSGTFTLTGSNTYSGGTAVTEGALVADNSSGSATGSGSVEVNIGAQLSGSGSVSGAVT
ncbi:MAG: hypothetical protein GY720_06000, partial [bacterium]|nr:hypothetical protein [bacterium]